MDSGGSKNMILLEYMNDAIVIDCGTDLGVDLPGINYAIPDTTYLDSISHKLRAFVITHGHLDHIGGLPHIMPKYPGVRSAVAAHAMALRTVSPRGPGL